VRYVRRVPLGHHHDFELWLQASNSSTANPPTFKDLADNWHDGTKLRHPRTSLLHSLVQSQGSICAWTGQRLTDDNAHIDHVTPQSVDPSLVLSLPNLVAAFPKSGAAARFGAHVRGSKFHPSMVRPNEQVCEDRFRYWPSGKISERLPEDSGAVFTITELKLDHAALVEARKAAIIGFKDRKTYAPDLMSLRKKFTSNKPGTLPPFAPAIVSALP
jgi:uncharacterized protein (TIGR02646 family)